MIVVETIKRLLKLSFIIPLYQKTAILSEEKCSDSVQYLSFIPQGSFCTVSYKIVKRDFELFPILHKSKPENMKVINSS